MLISVHSYSLLMLLKTSCFFLNMIHVFKIVMIHLACLASVFSENFFFLVFFHTKECPQILS